MAKSDIAPSGSSQSRFTRYAWGVLVYNLGVVVWGAYVRATGSGAGCGNHWPLCNGDVTPQAPELATIIEYTHRLMTALDLALIALLVVWAMRVFPKRHPARLAAMLSAVFLVAEALIGAGLVLLNHVADNPSVNRAWSLSAHLINTLTLIACLALTAWWAGGRPPITVRGKELWLAVASLAAFMVLGVTGAIAALGDTLFPARSLAEGFAQDFSPTANVFLRLRMWHPILAGAVGLWLGIYGLWATVKRPDTRLPAGIMMSLVGAQMVAGMTNLFLLAPVWLQLVHLLMADVLWVSLVLLIAIQLAAPAEAPVYKKRYAY
jgi:heme A synthase